MRRVFIEGVPAPIETVDLAAFGARCRELRERRGLSQLDMVTRHGFSLSHYQKLERGALDPRCSTLRRLALAYRVKLSRLIDGL